MNWYKKAQWDMFGQPLEFQEKIQDPVYNEMISGKDLSWHDEKKEYKTGPAKDYYEKMKGITGEIVWMSPDEYIDRCIKGGYKIYLETVGSWFGKPNFSYEQFKNVTIEARRYSTVGVYNNKNLLDIYKDRWVAGEQPPMGYITYNNEGEYVGQQGMHRAIMAKDLGVIQIPVLIVNEKNINENELVQNSKTE